MANSANTAGAVDARLSTGTVIIGVLAIVQAAAGILRALHWLDAGGDLMGKGLLLMPLVGVMAMARGALVGTIAFLFFVFACGLFLRQSWARWLASPWR